MEIIRKLWWGLYPLPKAFWGFFVLGFFAVWISVAIPAALLAMFVPTLRPIFLIVGMVLIWTYWAIASVGVWRSANDSKNYVALYRYSAKFIVLIIAAKVAFTISSGGGQAIIGGIMSSWR